MGQTPPDDIDETTADEAGIVALDCAPAADPSSSSKKRYVFVPESDVIRMPRRIAAKLCASLPTFKFSASK